jgi:hypothetical protein
MAATTTSERMFRRSGHRFADKGHAPLEKVLLTQIDAELGANLARNMQCSKSFGIIRRLSSNCHTTKRNALISAALM